MNVVFVVDRAHDFPFELPGARIVSARDYLTDSTYSNGATSHVVNLARTERYQDRGYYVSLLAEARGCAPLPQVKTIEDLQSVAFVQTLGADIDALAQRELAHVDADSAELDAYFGCAVQAHPSLAQQLFQRVPAPLLKVRFERQAGQWRLVAIRALAAAEVSMQEKPLLARAAAEYLSGRRAARTAATAQRPRLAILRDAAEPDPPSNAAALRRFEEAAREVGLDPELIGPQDIARLPEFSGLFIRATTHVSHYSYEFSRRAAELGLVVIDDPDSILKCTNKVYLHELMTRHRVLAPRTLSVHRENLHQVIPTLGLPCILKQPDSAFSLGVAKVESARALRACAMRLFERSELVIAQQWLPTEFDWRVCVLDRRPLFVCRYFMAPGHWQVIKRESAQRHEGTVETLSVAEAPEIVTQTALRAANLIGNGFYGVDLKQVDGECYLIEVNDNPNVDAGNEDRVLQGALYREIMGVFARRIGATATSGQAV